MSHEMAASPAPDLNRDLAVSSAAPVPPQPQAAAARDYEIGPEDLIEITLFNVDPEDGLPGKLQVRLSHTGFVTLPLLGKVRVGGLTVAGMEQMLREKYGEFMYGPEVGVMVAEYRSQSISVLGAVKTPGIYPVTGTKTVRDLLALAGGITEAAGVFTQVTRQETDGKETYVINLQELLLEADGKLNLTVHSGDVINVPLAGSFFVDGYVRQPGAYPLLREYTLSQALMVAGGLAEDAKLNAITVFRRDEQGVMQALTFDLGKTQRLEAEGVRVVENDVIVVPANVAKMFVKSVLSSVGFGLRASSMNLGLGGRAFGGGWGGNAGGGGGGWR